MKNWFRIEAIAGDPSTVDIYIVDIIGGWMDEYFYEGGGPGVITAKAFVTALVELSDMVKTIRLHVNSPGGDIFAGVAIANALRDQRLTKRRTIDVYVDGLAASAASIVIMAGTTIRMGDNALMFVHNPWSLAIGYATDLRKIASELDTIRDAIVATYQWQSRLSAEELVALMDAETWLDADEAIAKGFATEKVEGLKAAAGLEPRSLAKLRVPDQYRARVDALLVKPTPSPAPAEPAAAADILRLCREGECLDLAEELVTEGATLEQVQNRVAEERRVRAAATARAEQIRGLCAMAKLPELADGYVQGAMSLDAVKAQLTLLTAKLDQIEIDGSLSPDQGRALKPRINVSAIYDERNRLTKE